ncbi:MAG: DUF3347 domain-containing protein [Bacteroidetes bacterium]|nr:DUF3347 domain-containing protein [Bacteroidota bacterium]
MKKGFLILAILVAAIAVYFLFFYTHPDENKDTQKQTALMVSAHTDDFNKNFLQVMQTYYTLKDAFVNWDTAKASATALQLSTEIPNLPLKEMKADSLLINTALSYSFNVAGQARIISAEETIEGKRIAFNNLSENLYNLLRTVKYDQGIIYHDKCPMAFKDSIAAFWLSDQLEIVNPYLGNNHPKYHSGMLHCGDVEDSIGVANH